MSCSMRLHYNSREQASEVGRLSAVRERIKAIKNKIIALLTEIEEKTQ
jgi:hypothetical protein